MKNEPMREDPRWNDTSQEFRMKPDPEKMRITVTVAGTPNSGKTTVAHIIRNALQGYGIFCTLDDSTAGQQDSIPPLYRAALSVADKTVVDIKTLQVGRKGI